MKYGANAVTYIFTLVFIGGFIIIIIIVVVVVVVVVFKTRDVTLRV